MENIYKNGLVEEIKYLDEKVNEEKFDVRFGEKLITKLAELWKIAVAEKIK